MVVTVAAVVVVGRVAMVAMAAVARQVLHSIKAGQLLHPELCAACVCFEEGLLQRACLAVLSWGALALSEVVAVPQAGGSRGGDAAEEETKVVVPRSGRARYK